MKKYLKIFLLILLIMDFVHTEKKRAFLEMVSTESCPYCLTATDFLHDWKNPGSPSYLGHDMARNWIIIHYHHDDHLNGLMENSNSQSDPVEYRFTSGNGFPYSEELAWYPLFVFGGEVELLSVWEDLPNYAQEMREEETPVSLSLEGTVFSDFDALVKLTITSEEDLSSKNLRLFVAVTMDSVVHVNESDTNQDYHHDVFLSWVGNSGQGTDCGDGCEDGQSISLGKDETLVKTYSWTLDENPPVNADPYVNPITWDKKNIKIVAFVQDFGTSEVLQVATIARTGGIHTGLNDELVLSDGFNLEQNYPNPFNPITTISYDLPEESLVSLSIYNLMGKQVKTLVNYSQDAGKRIAVWDGTDKLGRQVSAGVYLYRIQAGEFSQTRKMLFLK